MIRRGLILLVLVMLLIALTGTGENPPIWLILPGMLGAWLLVQGTLRALWRI